MSAAPVTQSRLQTRLATVALLLVTAAWGSTFFLTKDLLRDIPAGDYLAIRFSVAAVAMIAVFWRQVRALTPRQWRHGLLLGLLYGVAQVVQTTGLAHTSASRSGFITGMYVVLTPLLGAAMFAERIGRLAWVGVALSFGGLAVLSLGGGGGWGLSIGVGEWLTLASAVLYALHIVFLSRFATGEGAAGLAVVQIGVCAVVAGLAAAPGGVMVPPTTQGWVALLYMALVAGALAMWAQTWAQAHLSATRAAILMTMEPVFAAGFAVAFGAETLTLAVGVGGALIVAAMYVVELGGRQSPPVVTHPSAQ